MSLKEQRLGDDTGGIQDFLLDRSNFTPGFRAYKDEENSPTLTSIEQCHYEGIPTASTNSMISDRSSRSDTIRRRSNSETSSQISSSSTDASSTSPPPNRRPMWHTQTDTSYNYSLRCEFAIVGCEIVFHPENWEDWISHTRSHFVGVRPPPKAVCVFCDGPDGTFENCHDPERNWFLRMIHIGRHHMEHAVGMRPDYFLFIHMRRSGLLAEEVFQEVMKYTEREINVDGLVPFNHQTEKMKRKQHRELLEKVDLKKERRQMRKEGRHARSVKPKQ